MKVKISPHAQARAEERFPDLRTRTIEREVTAGIRSGRLSHLAPAWLRGYTDRIDKTRRFVWTKSRERVYVVSRRKSHAHVITVLRNA